MTVYHRLLTISCEVSVLYTRRQHGLVGGVKGSGGGEERRLSALELTHLVTLGLPASVTGRG